jgi:hypothetical protein
MGLFVSRFILSEETVEIFIGADFETLREKRRRFAILNIPRHQFSEATGAAARRAAKPQSVMRYPAFGYLSSPNHMLV